MASVATIHRQGSLASSLLFPIAPLSSPSAADIAVTRQLRDAGKVIGIEVTDHVILGRPEIDPSGKGWYSFRSAELL